MMKNTKKLGLYISLGILLYAGGTGVVCAQSTAEKKVLDDIRTTRAELTDIKRETGEEQGKLISEIDKLEVEASALSKDLRKLDASDASRETSLSRMKRNNETDKEVFRYVVGTLKTFASSHRARLHSAEQQSYGKKMEDIETSSGAAAEGDLNGLLSERLKSLDLAFEYLDANAGGHHFDGEAVSKQGDIYQGKFLVLGPIGYFTSEDEKLVGQVEPVSDGDTGMPSIYEMPERYVGDLAATVKSGSGSLALDPTLGKAMQMEQTNETIAEHVAKGGVVGYCILGIGLISILLAIFKVIEIKTFRVPRMREINDILDDLIGGRDDVARERAKKISGESGEMVQKGVSYFHSKRTVMEEVMYEKIVAMRPKMERFLPFLAVTAAAAPLMGLLGTVMGMIKTFKLISVLGTGNAKNLSSGISEALVTTELGLVVAIPVLIIHGFLKRMSRGRIGAVESAALSLLNGKSEILANKSNVQSKGDLDTGDDIESSDELVVSPA